MFEVKKGSNFFYIGESDNNPIAEMTYVNTEDNLIIIDHTFVSEELTGQGVGKLLLKEMVDFARNEGKKIIPLCPYAKAQMYKNNEFPDMIYK